MEIQPNLNCGQKTLQNNRKTELYVSKKIIPFSEYGYSILENIGIN